MERKVYSLSLVLMQFSFVIFGNEVSTKPTSPSLIDILNVTLRNRTGSSLNANDNITSILRYGFHKTHDCQDFYKTYVCVKKCLESGYHVAESDSLCVCKCYKNRDKKIMFGTKNTTNKYPIPTTKKPIWAGSNNQNLKLSGGEIVDTSNEFSNDSLALADHVEFILNPEDHSVKFQEGNNASVDGDAYITPAAEIEEAGNVGGSKEGVKGVEGGEGGEGGLEAESGKGGDDGVAGESGKEGDGKVEGEGGKGESVVKLEGGNVGEDLSEGEAEKGEGGKEGEEGMEGEGGEGEGGAEGDGEKSGDDGVEGESGKGEEGKVEGEGGKGESVVKEEGGTGGEGLSEGEAEKGEGGVEGENGKGGEGGSEGEGGNGGDGGVEGEEGEVGEEGAGSKGANSGDNTSKEPIHK